MNMFMAQTSLQQSALTQILSVVVGLLIMAGSALFWHQNKNDNEKDGTLGFVCWFFALAGLILTLWGIGGVELFNAINNHTL